MKTIALGIISRTVALAALLSALRLGAQPPDHTLTRLRALHLREAPGPVPLIYSPAVKQRAIRFQKALQAAHQWYEKRLHLRLPITLAVLDLETFKKAGAIGMPYAEFKPGLVVLPSHLEDLTSLRRLGVDFALTSEAVAFHEAGHIFANTLKIDGSGFVNELVANIFVAAYIRAARPDLKVHVGGAVR